jgi:hypothetical protein
LAQAPAHRFGQIIGNTLEDASESILRRFADEHNLYLDKGGTRAARGGYKKLKWRDSFGNSHGLDYVMECGGTESEFGSPVAFIEIAWRSYTKHARNKVQEIQGAVLPLRDTYRHSAPFAGAVLAGMFTKDVLDQLRSQGFSVLYVPYEAVVSAFEEVGIDASFKENTPEAEFRDKVEAWDALSSSQRDIVAEGLVDVSSDKVTRFISELKATITRQVSSVRIMPLHGLVAEKYSVEEAISFIKEYSEYPSPHPFSRYEVEVLYNNGNEIRGKFLDKISAVQFLQDYRAPRLRSVDD